MIMKSMNQRGQWDIQSQVLKIQWSSVKLSFYQTSDELRGNFPSFNYIQNCTSIVSRIRE
ncbi:hypothetical protein SLEP1_g2496 [Rubroshorea leprosula]|uniref:Uncharacterized protein n=1 Tax=Rubroshorea leprosula TaxID=152421 RepID=A0AAV5HNC1_9ROSI|nr:hypothetical protein SLEP1_g2496 [Rubroshorea leprosula]